MIRVVLALLATVTPAFADEPSVARAGDANLESTDRRKTLQLTFAVGGSIAFGFGLSDVNGNGGSGSLRLGRVMNPKWLATLEVTGTATLHRPGVADPIATNNASGFMVGAQYYAGPALWLRAASGIGSYTARMSDLFDTGVHADHDLLGVAGLGSAGIEIGRFRHVSVGFELYVLTLVLRDGVVASSALAIDLGLY